MPLSEDDREYLENMSDSLLTSEVDWAAEWMAALIQEQCTRAREELLARKMAELEQDRLKRNRNQPS